MIRTNAFLRAALLCAAFWGAAGVRADDPPPKIRVACVGDSITFGSGLDNPARFAYPRRLQRFLDGSWPGRYEVRNFGHPGSGVYVSTPSVKWHTCYREQPEHKDALAWKPDIVVCNLGINDITPYLDEFKGARPRGEFVEQYLALLSDYSKLETHPKLFIWTKLGPLAPNHDAHLAPGPFLMQDDLRGVARRAGAKEIDMLEPLRPLMATSLAKDGVHPDVAGARRIAASTFRALFAPAREPPALPEDIAKTCEVWLCAGDSGFVATWGDANETNEERRRVRDELAGLGSVDVRFLDSEGAWRKLNPVNALDVPALAVSFAWRRAKAADRPVALVCVAAKGASVAAFLPENLLCAVDGFGLSRYPTLSKMTIARSNLDPEGKPLALGVSSLYDAKLRALEALDFTGTVWFHGEADATAPEPPFEPRPRAYAEEVLRAAVQQFRGYRKLPMVVVGLPKSARRWEGFRAAQKLVAEETGAVFVDTAGAGLGTEDGREIRDWRPFAGLAAEAAATAVANRKRPNL